MSNPLLDLGLCVPFDRVHGEHVEPAVRQRLKQAEAAVDAIILDPAPPSYPNTLGALERAIEFLEFTMSLVSHLESVATTPDLRQAYNQVLPDVSAFYAGLPLKEGLWQRLKALAASPAALHLDPIERRLLDKTLSDFRRHGADLGPDSKQKLQEIDRELSTATNQFSQNLLDSTHTFELLFEDQSALAGLPASAQASARDAARQKGKSGYRLTLQAPSVTAVLGYADSGELRQRIWQAFNHRASSGPKDNRPLIVKILELRKRKAELLGFRQFADLVTEDRMAKTGEAARRFVRELTEKTRPAFERENAELQAFRRELEGPSAPPLEPWDIAYYAEKLRKARYHLDQEELRAYLPSERCLSGAFALAERLFGVRIEKVTGYPSWDTAVQSYGLREASGALLGVFHVDPYPRENKRGGAWMHGLWAAIPPEPHLAVFCLNASPPNPEYPSLLLHQELETVFHEFGHLLHHCLSKVPVRSLAGTRVAHDFVELPSQIMENFCCEPEVLALFAADYRSQKPIPTELVERLRRAQKFRAANAQMRQLGFAELDLALHMDYDPHRDGDVMAYSRSILQRFAPAALPQDYGMIAGFSHLFSDSVGYAAGYYSYKWAEVLDADAFTRFDREGVLNPAIGMEFRQTILEQGNSHDPMELFQRFMGRPPRLEALLERQGLL